MRQMQSLHTHARLKLIALRERKSSTALILPTVALLLLAEESFKSNAFEKSMSATTLATTGTRHMATSSSNRFPKLRTQQSHAISSSTVARYTAAAMHSQEAGKRICNARRQHELQRHEHRCPHRHHNCDHDVANGVADKKTTTKQQEQRAQHRDGVLERPPVADAGGYAAELSLEGRRSGRSAVSPRVAVQRRRELHQTAAEPLDENGAFVSWLPLMVQYDCGHWTGYAERHMRSGTLTVPCYSVL
ncbi:hypothetical protein FI667_g4174, partial [Globisporangium splendens]